MENGSQKKNKHNIPKSKSLNYESFERNVNIRRKNLQILNSKIDFSLSNMNNLLSKINHVKNLVVFKKYDIKDLKSVRNLDNSALIYSKHIKQEVKNSSKLLYAYNLSSLDLDNFMKELAEPKKNEKNYENVINFDQNEYNRLKKEFDLASGGKTRHDKILGNIFLKNESKMRDLYNLKLDLFLREQRKKISQNYIYEIVQKVPMCIREKDKRFNKQYSDIKSKYYDMYKISKSFELEEGLKDVEILKEEENKNEELFITKNSKIINQKKNYPKYNKDYLTYNQNNYIEESINENDKEENKRNYVKKDTMHLPKTTNADNKNFDTDNVNSTSNNNNIRNIINIRKKRKPFSARIVKTNSFNATTPASIATWSTKNNNNKQGIRLKADRVNSSIINQKSNYDTNNSNYNRVFINNYSYKNKHKLNRPISPNITSKQTLYSSTSSSRPISAFSSFNYNNTIFHLNNNNKLKLNLNQNSSISKYKKNTDFDKYINELNKIIKYSNYTTNKFKKSSKELGKKKLFQKSNSQIFERTNFVDIQKIKKNLKLDRNPHSYINDRKLILDNSRKVKLMLIEKHKEILNGIVLELLANQNRVHNFYSDYSHYEKVIQKFKRNKKFNKLANETMVLEKKLDKEKVYEMFEQDEDKIMDYLKEINNKHRFDDEEWKHIILKHKNLTQMDKANRKNMFLNGNLHKKHLVAKYRKIKD